MLPPLDIPLFKCLQACHILVPLATYPHYKRLIQWEQLTAQMYVANKRSLLATGDIISDSLSEMQPLDRKNYDLWSVIPYHLRNFFIAENNLTEFDCHCREGHEDNDLSDYEISLLKDVRANVFGDGVVVQPWTEEHIEQVLQEAGISEEKREQLRCSASYVDDVKRAQETIPSVFLGRRVRPCIEHYGDEESDEEVIEGMTPDQLMRHKRWWAYSPTWEVHLYRVSDGWSGTLTTLSPKLEVRQTASNLVLLEKALLDELTDALHRNMQRVLQQGSELEKLKANISTWRSR